MEDHERNLVVFDYTTFLAAACRKKWTLTEVFLSIAPVFGYAWKNSVQKEQNIQERVWELALGTLSAQSSDVTNIIRLTELAKHEGVKEIRLMMPYELEQSQLDNISQESEVQISRSAQDEFTIYL
ncbi:transporter [Vibrio sp. JC009]|uniref:transporter n=1 Tax=Vibrio sp. JC009 TaxID=2912314 RepID=UPI0023B0C47C|nr:transporter [Vibrio sp. JC009]WED23035.1 transporter [Vibrio sp. JC009]